MALTNDDLKKIGDLIDERLDEKLDARFVEFEKGMDKKMDEKFDWKFAERDKMLDRRLKEHSENLIKQLKSFMLEYFPTKQEMNDKIDEAKDELRDEFRDRFMVVEDSIVKFSQRWDFGEPVIVGKRLKEHGEAIDDLDSRVTVLEGG